MLRDRTSYDSAATQQHLHGAKGTACPFSAPPECILHLATMAAPPPWLPRAAAALRNADCLLFHAGAGMGVDSGLPDFRGPQGFWRAYPPMKDLVRARPRLRAG